MMNESSVGIRGLTIGVIKSDLSFVAVVVVLFELYLLDWKN